MIDSTRDGASYHDPERSATREMKQEMKTHTVMTVVLSSMFVIASHAADRESTVSVTGKAELKAKPDAAYITLYA